MSDAPAAKKQAKGGISLEFDFNSNNKAATSSNGAPKRAPPVLSSASRTANTKPTPSTTTATKTATNAGAKTGASTAARPAFKQHEFKPVDPKKIQAKAAAHASTSRKFIHNVETKGKRLPIMHYYMYNIKFQIGLFFSRTKNTASNK